MAFDDCPGDRKAESGMAAEILALRPDGVEPVEDRFAQLRGNARAFVVDANQDVVADMYGGDLDQAAHLRKICAVYGERYGVLDQALRETMPSGFTWTKPEGGMFLWVTGPANLDGVELLQRAIVQKVAFVPGRDFFPADAGKNFLRLNYSNSTPERIREGVKRLAALCQ